MGQSEIEKIYIEQGMTVKYAKEFLEGQKFQDFTADELYKRGICVRNYVSYIFQIKVGENQAGIEIKHDKLWRKTGNLYIEIAEKSNKENENYVISGIYRNDNTWLYVIGDYGKLFLLPVKYLRTLHQRNKYVEVQIDTSKGYLLPIPDAEKCSIKTIIIKKDEIINNELPF